MTNPDLDCVDCTNYQADAARCRACVNDSERDGRAFPLFAPRKPAKAVLVGLNGRARVGKDTVADRLVAHHGYVKHSFAAPIRAAAALLFGLTPEELNGPAKETVDPNLGMSPREYMQGHGSWLREMDPFIFVKSCMGRIARSMREGYSVVVTDVRFPNEAEFLRIAGGTVAFVERPGVDAVRAHESELPLPYELIDRVLLNNASLDVLNLRVDSFANWHARGATL